MSKTNHKEQKMNEYEKLWMINHKRKKTNDYKE